MHREGTLLQNYAALPTLLETRANPKLSHNMQTNATFAVAAIDAIVRTNLQFGLLVEADGGCATSELGKRVLLHLVAAETFVETVSKAPTSLQTAIPPTRCAYVNLTGFRQDLFRGGPPRWVLPCMTGYSNPRSEGPTVASDFAPALSLLTKKAPTNNIVVGSDPAQIRFLEHTLRTEVTLVAFVNDDMLLGQSGRFFQVRMADGVANLSPEMKTKTGIWSAEPIVKGSASIHMLVKFAWSILYPAKKDPKIERAVLDATCDQVVAAGMQDIRGSLWLAVWLLTGPVEKTPVWKEPWEHATEWMPSAGDPELRLNTLYRTLTEYVTYLFGKDNAIKHLPKGRQNRLKELSLDRTKVYETIRILGLWRSGRIHDPWFCGLQVAAVWA